MFKSPPSIIPIFEMIPFTSKSEADHKENQPESNIRNGSICSMYMIGSFGG